LTAYITRARERIWSEIGVTKDAAKDAGFENLMYKNLKA
jgi:hypothetical protein